jgi:hypothetical protein
MKRQQSTAIWAGSLALLGAVGCSGGGGTRAHSAPWADERAQVIDSDRNIRELEAADADECLAFEFDGDDECVTRADECGADVAADVVVDADGKVVSVVCYPEGESLTVEEIEAQDGNVEQNQNNAVIALDDDDDGVDIEGDLSVDANNVVIYGEGPDVSVVSGDVNVDGNNIIVRGVRIQGDVQVLANNAVFLLCVIEGDVEIIGNNTILSSCDIHGKVTIRGNNTQFTNNRVVGEFADLGKNTICAENFAAIDANEDLVFSEDELGDALVCNVAED